MDGGAASQVMDQGRVVGLLVINRSVCFTLGETEDTVGMRGNGYRDKEHGIGVDGRVSIEGGNRCRSNSKGDSVAGRSGHVGIRRGDGVETARDESRTMEQRD